MLLRRLTIPSPDSKPLRLVSLSKGKTTEYVATFSDTAGLCFYTVPDGGLVSQVGTLATEHGGNLNPFDDEDLCVYTYTKTIEEAEIHEVNSHVGLSWARVHGSRLMIGLLSSPGWTV